MTQATLQDFLQEVSAGNLVEGTISSPKQKHAEGIIKISIRSIEIKGKSVYQISAHYAQKVIHKNVSPAECVLEIERALCDYRQGIFTSQAAGYHLLAGKKDQITVLKKTFPIHASSVPVIPVAHNRTKQHVLVAGVPVPFLVELGIMASDGSVYPKKYDKFRQINRFLEMVRDCVEDLPSDRPVRIIDFGCGKAYLTFALHHYLHTLLKRDVDIAGLDLKKDVIQTCQALASRLELPGLTFSVGDISTYQDAGQSPVDLVISLHACDIASDAALERAVHWQTKVILCVPCCQHELYSQVECEALSTLLRHGILRERFAAMVTDAARAELLTMHGYEVQILEFIDMEHTPKNLLIRAIKKPSSNHQEKARARYAQFKDELHINPTLERML